VATGDVMVKLLAFGALVLGVAACAVTVDPAYTLVGAGGGVGTSSSSTGSSSSASSSSGAPVPCSFTGNACGGEPGVTGDAGTLYVCLDDAQSVVQKCQSWCQVHPGTDDQCQSECGALGVTGCRSDPDCCQNSVPQACFVMSGLGTCSMCCSTTADCGVSGGCCSPLVAGSTCTGVCTTDATNCL